MLTHNLYGVSSVPNGALVLLCFCKSHFTGHFLVWLLAYLEIHCVSNLGNSEVGLNTSCLIHRLKGFPVSVKINVPAVKLKTC